MCACSIRPLEIPKGTMLPPTLHGGTAHNVPFIIYIVVPLGSVPLEGVIQDIVKLIESHVIRKESHARRPPKVLCDKSVRPVD